MLKDLFDFLNLIANADFFSDLNRSNFIFSNYLTFTGSMVKADGDGKVMCNIIKFNQLRHALVF